MTPDDFKSLVKAGLTTDQIALVMEMMARDAKAYTDAEEARKAKGRQRVAEWRANRSNVTVTQQNVTEPLVRGDARGLDKTSIQRIEPQEVRKEEKTRSPREMLETVLSPERAKDVVEMRQRIKAPLTARGAELLARELGKWPIPDEAADEMVQRAWRGFKPEWMTGDRARAGPAGKTNRFEELANAIGASNGQDGFGTAAAGDFDAGRSLSGIEYRRN